MTDPLAPPPSVTPMPGREAGADGFALSRARMVDSQIRPNMVSDPRIIRAMRELPRERFVPDAVAGLAYADRPIRIGATRIMLEPRITARMLQAAAPRGGEKALVVAAGTGYSACLLAALGLDVVALESDPALAAWGTQLCGGLAPGMRFQAGALEAGWAAGAPYDLIVIDGAVRELPDTVCGQLRATGRLVAVLWREGKFATAVLAEASTHGLRARAQFDAAAALIPELEPAPVFSF